MQQEILPCVREAGVDYVVIVNGKSRATFDRDAFGEAWRLHLATAGARLYKVRERGCLLVADCVSGKRPCWKPVDGVFATSSEWRFPLTRAELNALRDDA